MLIKSVELYKTVFKPGDYPEPKEREIAFVGRSNVGKSTLLNAIFRRGLAHTSSTPGKTRSVNFYLINSKHFFVDLPGYGYAKASHQEIKRWQALITDYFKSRPNLNLIALLLDSRHNLQKKDLEMLQWIQYYSIPFVAVLTKTDKLSGNQLSKMLNSFRKELETWGSPLIVPVSAKTRKGISELINILFGK
ncbi:GTP-binding protein [Kosmotoga arenicorallina S304]|uniref:Probable GTP-binding protein EngB n=1 Tax=Kosmotoga arenicorallina S304 TaxID=1453497 RepID=A0A176JYZ4_9BACT|nr:ribosome biogenesis GTP-binding protein YihA/YsxC [Kosmotoga arenicorallina]OAA29178.1 GTP-binding protein [Kosmotoga arenicorallina S304]